MSRRRELTLSQAVSEGVACTRPWGYFLPPVPLVSPEARLVIVPPGTSAGRHRLWLLSGTWQRYAWVLALTVFAATLLFTRAEWIFVITAAVAVWLLGSTLIHVLASRQPQRPREIRSPITRTRRGFHPAGGSFIELQTHLNFLDALEREGRITPAQYAQEWAAIYRALPSSERKATRP